jgi:hypothetical protein
MIFSLYYAGLGTRRPVFALLHWTAILTTFERRFARSRMGIRYDIDMKLEESPYA